MTGRSRYQRGAASKKRVRANRYRNRIGLFDENLHHGRPDEPCIACGTNAEAGCLIREP